MLFFSPNRSIRRTKLGETRKQAFELTLLKARQLDDEYARSFDEPIAPRLGRGAASRPVPSRFFHPLRVHFLFAPTRQPTGCPSPLSAPAEAARRSWTKEDERESLLALLYLLSP